MVLNVATKTIEGIWPMLIIFLVAVISVRIAYLFNHKEKFCFYKEFGTLVFLVYILLLFQLLTSTEINSGSGVNYIPFTEIFRYKIGSSMFLYNVLGNIIAFIPFGFFISYYLKAKKITPLFLVTLVTSSCVEFVQLNIGRSFDVDDVILNVIGGMLGYLLYIILTTIKNRLPKFLQKDFIYNVLCFAIVVLLVLYFLGYIKVGFLK